MQVEFDVPVQMRDGVVLRADVYQPDGAGPWPVLIQRTPYSKANPTQAYANLDTVQAVRRGYIVVQQDVRGRFSSDGEWQPWTSEADDGHDTIAWAAQLPNANGRVGMFGASYTGNTQWSAAATSPPSLGAIAPQVTWTDPDDGLYFRGGAFEHALNLNWALETAMGSAAKLAEPERSLLEEELIGQSDLLRNGAYWELPSNNPPLLSRTGSPDLGTQRAVAGDETAYRCRVRDYHGEIDVPSLNVGGWYDVFLQGALDNYLSMRNAGTPTHLIVGPWTHTSLYGIHGAELGQWNFGIRSLMPGVHHGSRHDVQLDWFDRWLKNEPSAEFELPVRIFVMGANVWRSEPEWPLARAVDTPLYFKADGQLVGDAPDFHAPPLQFEYDPGSPAPTQGGNHHFRGNYPAGPQDQAAIEARSDVATFTSAVLATDLEVTGRVRAILHAATDGSTTDWVVRLCDVDENGRSVNVADGITRAKHIPNAASEVEVDLWSTSMLFRAGHRIRVQVTSSNFPRWDRNLNGGLQPRTAKQSIHADLTMPSRIVLPVVP